MDSTLRKERSIVVVSRKNGQPEVKHTVVYAIDQLRVEMTLEDFLDEVAWQMAKESSFSFERKAWITRVLKMLGDEEEPPVVKRKGWIARLLKWIGVEQESPFSRARKAWIAKAFRMLGSEQEKTSQAMGEFMLTNAYKVILRMKESTIYAPPTLVLKD